jgi:hypothetical protein
LSLLSPSLSEGRGYAGTDSAAGVEAETEGQKRAGPVKRGQKRGPNLVIPFVEKGDNQKLATGMMFEAVGTLVKAHSCRAADVPLHRRSDMQVQAEVGMKGEGEEWDIRGARHRVHRGCGVAPRQ